MALANLFDRRYLRQNRAIRQIVSRLVGLLFDVA
jgi:hypothetical protein